MGASRRSDRASTSSLRWRRICGKRERVGERRSAEREGQGQVGAFRVSIDPGRRRSIARRGRGGKTKRSGALVARLGGAA
jgi:hypothetical protein